jgi:hypothetical protein
MPNPDQVEPIKAAGVIARSPSGRVLMLKRAGEGSWSLPSLDECGPRVGGLIEGGDDAASAQEAAIARKARAKPRAAGPQRPPAPVPPPVATPPNETRH